MSVRAIFSLPLIPGQRVAPWCIRCEQCGWNISGFVFPKSMTTCVWYLTPLGSICWSYVLFRGSAAFDVSTSSWGHRFASIFKANRPRFRAIEKYWKDQSSNEADFINFSDVTVASDPFQPVGGKSCNSASSSNLMFTSSSVCDDGTKVCIRLNNLTVDHHSDVGMA